MKYYKGIGFVVKKRDLFEKDVIITLLTRNYGKLDFVVKGAKNITSTKASSIQLGNLIYFLAYKGRNLDTIIDVKLLSNFYYLKKDLKYLSFFYFILEIINKVEIPLFDSDKIFSLVNNVFKRAEKEKLSILTLNFLSLFLDYLGYSLDDKTCIRCNKNFARLYFFDFKQKGFVCNNCYKAGDFEISKDNYIKDKVKLYINLIEDLIDTKLNIVNLNKV